MEQKIVSVILLTLLLIGMLLLAFNIQPVRASGTIYIRPDGSVEGTDKIHRDEDLYTFTDNIYDSIVVEIDNIMLDGAGYTLQGSGSERGVDLTGRSNVTIKNVEIKSFWFGIWLSMSSNNSIVANNITNQISIYGIGLYLLSSSSNSISGNNITNNPQGIYVTGFSNFNSISGNNIKENSIGIRLMSDKNSIVGNNITNSNLYGIMINIPSNNSIVRNNITNNNRGIYVTCASNNTISGNNIKENSIGIRLYVSSNNKFYHNNFIDNTQQVYMETSGYVDFWDDGYPSGGNYWSDYATRYPTECDDCQGENQDIPGSDGIWDSPYVIDTNNQDNYPLVNPWTPAPPVVMATVDIDPDTLNLKSRGQWITAYTQLPDEYDPEDIDATTILLNETISPVLDPKYDFVANSSEYLVDHDGDGISERMVKFDRATVRSFIYSQGIRYGDVALTVTGALVGGTPFEGTDVIFVNYAGDVDNNGVVNVFDIIAIKAHWYPGPPTGPLGYHANADLNSNGQVNVFDIIILKVNFGETVP